MKKPDIDLRSVQDFLLRHCEKIVAAAVGLGVVFLIWAGVGALRTLSVKESQTPEAINRVVKQAHGHIDSVPQAPADQLPKREPLAEKIDPWRTPLVPWWTGTAPASLSIAPPPAVAVLDRPLFDEAAKRGTPDVFPIEDLRAVAGLAVLPVAAAAPAAAAVPVPPAGQKKPDPAPGRRPPRGGDPLAMDAPLPVGPLDNAPKGRIVPYVIVTGLIPARKQHEEYRQRFAGCGFRDPKRDSPLWSDFEIDRATIGADGKEKWTSIDLADVARKRLANWGPVAAGPAAGMDAEFLLGANEDARSQTTPIGFCSPLPPLLEGDWNLADLHPWVIESLRTRFAPPVRQAEPVVPPDAGPRLDGPGFNAPVERRPEPAAAEARNESPAYRFFRFVDTDVAPGATYRYRVRIKLWNPNYDENPEKMRPHLTDPSLAVERKLAAAQSAPSPTATVPDPTRILVGMLGPDEAKDLKVRPISNAVEVLVLAPSVETGRFKLRALVADPGVVVDIDEKYNQKNQRDRARGEAIETRRLLLDARGRQEERRGGAVEKNKPDGGIPEPFEVICLRPDGSFEFASLDASEPLVDEHRSTRPPASKSDVKGSPAPVAPPRPGGTGL